jgi:hypothetical protein
MNQLPTKVLLLLLVAVSYKLKAQSPSLVGQIEESNPITVAVPFAGLAPDSRASGMGDVGVATSPDANSIHWNNAKLAFIDHNLGFSFSYSPWLGNIVPDMSLNYLSFYKRIDPIQTFGVSLRYFDMGEIQKTDVLANPIGIENPREAAIDATYSRKLSEYFSTALTLRFIWSDLAGSINNATGANAGTSLAFDLGTFYTRPVMFNGKESELSFGAHLSNIGQKITYAGEDQEDFIPQNFRIGTAFKTNLDAFNSLMFALDFNKLLVPTPPIYQRDANGNIAFDANDEPIILRGKDPNRSFISGTFGSFTDAPDGFGEEMSEFTISFGAEYWYKDVFAFRTGYFWEDADKGNRKYFTAGLGFRYQVFGLDLSYLIPQDQNHPLGDTLRLSFVFNMDKEEESTP